MILELRTALGIASRIYSQERHLVSNSTLKNTGIRDVVTDLDLKINNALADYFLTKNIAFISEEGPLTLLKKTGTFAILDPLDGSLNYLSSLPAYGTVIAIVESGILKYGGFSSHSEGITAYSDNEKIFFSRRYKVPTLPQLYVAPALLAYGPALNQSSKAFVNNLINADPKIFPGFHRIGSAAHGALQFVSGRYSSLICLDVRLWDIAGMLPMLNTFGEKTTFVSISNSLISVISYSRELPYSNLLDSLIGTDSSFELFDHRIFVSKLNSIIF
jgi:fructose-1,6-bisphosphatase/inositol monophosphatase family enzyme